MASRLRPRLKDLPEEMADGGRRQEASVAGDFLPLSENDEERDGGGGEMVRGRGQRVSVYPRDKPAAGFLQRDFGHLPLDEPG